jgi:hypothetical protein
MRSALVAVVLVLIAGCYRDKGAPAAPPANRVEEPRPATSDDVLAYLPVDAELVVGVEVSVLRQSALYRAFEQQLLDTYVNQLGEAQRCGIDPTRGLGRVTIAGKLDRDGNDFEGVVVFRGVDTTLALPCIGREATNKGKVERLGDFIVVTGEPDDTFAAARAGDSTLVIQIGRAATRASLTSILSSGAPLRTSPAFMGLFGRREANAAVWGMVNGASPFMADLRLGGPTPRSVDGTLRVTHELVATIRMTMTSPADADQIVQSLTPMLPAAKNMLSRLDVRADGNVVNLDAVATEAQLRAFVGMLGAFGP